MRTRPLPREQLARQTRVRSASTHLDAAATARPGTPTTCAPGIGFLACRDGAPATGLRPLRAHIECISRDRATAGLNTMCSHHARSPTTPPHQRASCGPPSPALADEHTRASGARNICSASKAPASNPHQRDRAALASRTASSVGGGPNSATCQPKRLEMGWAKRAFKINKLPPTDEALQYARHDLAHVSLLVVVHEHVHERRQLAPGICMQTESSSAFARLAERGPLDHANEKLLWALCMTAGEATVGSVMH